MEAMTAIKSRRSHRKFSDQKVTKEVIEKIVEAARFAPSWKNTQTVRYTVIENEDLLNEILHFIG